MPRKKTATKKKSKSPDSEAIARHLIMALRALNRKRKQYHIEQCLWELGYTEKELKEHGICWEPSTPPIGGPV